MIRHGYKIEVNWGLIGKIEYFYNEETKMFENEDGIIDGVEYETVDELIHNLQQYILDGDILTCKWEE